MTKTIAYRFDTINRHTLNLPVFGFVRAVDPYPSGDHTSLIRLTGRLQC